VIALDAADAAALTPVLAIPDERARQRLLKRIMRHPREAWAALALQLAPSQARAAGDSWGTPLEWIEGARAVMGGIDVDPASNAEAQARIQAAVHYTREDDGLTKPWLGRVWLNPPYSQPLVQQFTERLLTELEAGRATEACLLVNNASDARWYQRAAASCDAVLAIAGRVQFICPGTAGVTLPGARQGQSLLYFGPRAAKFSRVFAARGTVAVPRPSRSRTCVQCGGTFVARRDDALSCSSACRQARYRCAATKRNTCEVSP
jgi:ParB family chromosome partitioning protein